MKGIGIGMVAAGLGIAALRSRSGEEDPRRLPSEYDPAIARTALAESLARWRWIALSTGGETQARIIRYLREIVGAEQDLVALTDDVIRAWIAQQPDERVLAIIRAMHARTERLLRRHRELRAAAVREGRVESHDAVAETLEWAGQQLGNAVESAGAALGRGAGSLLESMGLPGLLMVGGVALIAMAARKR